MAPPRRPPTSAALRSKLRAAPAEPLDAVSAGTLTVRAYRELLRRILHLELAPGQTFSESEMAGELGLSKTPVREALVMLNLNRFVSVRSRSGYAVTAVTLRDARDLFAVRLPLEPEAAALAANDGVSAARLQNLREANAAARSSRDPDEALSANARFHLHLAGATHNHHLLRALTAPTFHTQRLYRLIVELTGRPEAALHDHDELLRAVVAGRPEQAREIAAEQLRVAHKWAFDALMSADVLQSTNLAAVDRGGEAGPEEGSGRRRLPR